MSQRRGLTITCLQKHPEHGYWTAHITANGVTLNVDRKHGSWLIVEQANGFERRREVLPYVAEALQARLPMSERRIPPPISKHPITASEDPPA